MCKYLSSSLSHWLVTFQTFKKKSNHQGILNKQIQRLFRLFHDVNVVSYEKQHLLCGKRNNPSKSNNRLWYPWQRLCNYLPNVFRNLASLLCKMTLIPATLAGFQARTACFRSRHSLAVRSRSALWLRHPKHETWRCGFSLCSLDRRPAEGF